MVSTLQRYLRSVGVLAALLLHINVAVLAAPSASTPKQQDVLVKPVFRAMVVGDSLSHGKDGQHTWRYRFWQYLRSPVSRVNPHFVGPFNGTWLDDGDRSTYWKMGGSYARDVDPAFLADSAFHACMWGRALAWSRDTVGEWVQDHQPDWVLVMMGFNDFAWMNVSIAETMNNMELFVDNVRAAKPDTKFLIANVPHQNFADSATRMRLVQTTDEYNVALNGNLTRIAAKGVAGSTIRLVDVNRVYGCQPHYCPDGWDGLHPTADGEYDLARAFSIAMVQMGLTEKPIGNCLID